MMRRSIKDESGVALGLAVILIVIVGVMGAGLLVFVRNDLLAVVEVNQGQQAFDAADAGAQAAKRQLLSDASMESYDGDDSGDLAWSYDPDDEDNDGKDLTFAGSNINVSIRYLPFHAEDGSCDDGSFPAADDPQEHPACAPDTKNGADDERNFFQVVSTGESDNGDAKRRVEAIYNTYDLGVPKAYYSPQAITISGNTCISDVSVFSLTSIKSTGNSGCEGGGKIEGTDDLYGKWKNEYNPTARDISEAGFGARDVDDDIQENGRDYDGSTNPQFVVEEGSEDPGNVPITFPFEHKTQEGERDEARIDFFREEAVKQSEENNDPSHLQTGNISDWPENSTNSTVVYVDASGASGGKVSWSAGGNCSDEPVKGTLIVDGAGLEVKGNDAFSGVTIVRDGEFTNSGSSCWDGFVTADEGMKLAGTPDPFVSEDVANRPGFYGVEQWSWRELYE